MRFVKIPVPDGVPSDLPYWIIGVEEKPSDREHLAGIEGVIRRGILPIREVFETIVRLKNL